MSQALPCRRQAVGDLNRAPCCRLDDQQKTAEAQTPSTSCCSARTRKGQPRELAGRGAVDRRNVTRVWLKTSPDERGPRQLRTTEKRAESCPNKKVSTIPRAVHVSVSNPFNRLDTSRNQSAEIMPTPQARLQTRPMNSSVPPTLREPSISVLQSVLPSRLAHLASCST